MAMRFKHGDLAVLCVSAGPASQAALDSVVTVVYVGPFSAEAIIPIGRVPGFAFSSTTFAGDYVVTAGVERFTVMDWQLRKIDPPAEPESLRHVEDVEVEA